MADVPAYEYEMAKGYAVVAFNPSLGDCRWGEIEKVGAEIKERLVALDRPSFLLDLTRLEFMGSSVVALIVKLWKAAQEKEGEMVVVNSSTMIGEVLEIAGLTRVWKIVSTHEEAEQMLGVTMFTPASPAEAWRSSLVWSRPSEIAASGDCSEFFWSSSRQVSRSPKPSARCQTSKKHSNTR
jgi:anti-anti-sigma factor